MDGKHSMAAMPITVDHGKGGKVGTWVRGNAGKYAPRARGVRHDDAAGLRGGLCS